MFNNDFSSKAVGKWCGFYSLGPSIQTTTDKPALTMHYHLSWSVRRKTMISLHAHHTVFSFWWSTSQKQGDQTHAAHWVSKLSKGTGLEHPADNSNGPLDNIRNEREMGIFLSTWRFLKVYLHLVVLVALCFLLSHDGNDSGNNNSITANIYWTLTAWQAQAKCLHTWSHSILTKLQWAEPLLSQCYRWRNEVRKRLQHFPRVTQQESKLTQSTCLNFYTLLPPTWFHTGKLWQSKSRNKMRSIKYLVLRKATVKGTLSMN